MIIRQGAKLVLYRDSQTEIVNIKEYCCSRLELAEYSLFTRMELAIPTYSVRKPNEEPKEMLSEAWGPYIGGLSTSWRDKDNNIIEYHDFHPGFRGLQSAFFFQHYGMKSNILDLTRDIDIALFFAQSRFSDNGIHKAISFNQSRPVIYIFILNKQFDRFLNSEELMEDHPLLRPKRQKCGILAGASFITRNYYSRFVSIRIHLG